MKRIYLIILVILITNLGLAQSNIGFNYKALITENGNPLVNHPVNIRFTLTYTGMVVYKETHSTTTDANGIINVNIGEGTPVTGDFSNIYWGYYHILKVEIDTGNGYHVFSDNQLRYVYKAKYADRAGHVDIVDKIRGIPVSSTLPTNGQVLKYNGTQFVPADDDTSGGSGTDGVVNSASFSGSATKTLTLGRSNGLGNVTATFTDAVNDADHSTTNEIQHLSISSNQISLSNGGGTVTLPNQHDADFYKVGTAAPATSINDNIYTNGKIGINVTVPSEALDIDGDILMRYDSNRNSLSFRSESSGNMALFAYQNKFEFSTWASEGIYFNTLAPSGGGALPRLIIHSNDGDVEIRKKLYIGTGNTNYVLPATRGNANEIMQIDANGHVNWAAPSSIADADFYKVGTTTPPTSINDDIYTQGSLEIKSNSGSLLVLSSATNNSSIRPGIQFKNNTSQFIAGDDGSNEIFGFYSKWGNHRTHDARLRVYGKASGSWGKYVEITHDGTDATIKTDTGNISLEPHSGEVQVSGKITAPATGNNDLKAFAYGTIDSNGSTLSGTGNFHVDHNLGAGIYKITFTGENYDDSHFTTVVSVHSIHWPSFIFSYATNNTLVVKIFDADGTTKENMPFSFVTYKN